MNSLAKLSDNTIAAMVLKRLAEGPETMPTSGRRALNVEFYRRFPKMMEDPKKKPLPMGCLREDEGTGCLIPD